MGRVIELAVDEGDLVEKGDLLLRIDPTQYEAEVARCQAALEQARSQLVESEASLDQAQRAYERAKRLHANGSDLLSDEALEDAKTRLDVAKATHEAARHGVAVSSAALDDARQNLAKTVIRAPMAGKIVRKNIEQGETAVIGTMNNPGSLLLTVADLSEMEAVVTVNETDVPSIKLGDAATLEVDAFPGTKFTGKVTRIGNSAIQTTGTSEAVDFEVRIGVDDPPPTLRPDLSATADIVTAERKGVLAIPIIALTVKEVAKEKAEAAASGGDDGRGSEGEGQGREDQAAAGAGGRLRRRERQGLVPTRQGRRGRRQLLRGGLGSHPRRRDRLRDLPGHSHAQGRRPGPDRQGRREEGQEGQGREGEKEGTRRRLRPAKPPRKGRRRGSADGRPADRGEDPRPRGAACSTSETRSRPRSR